MSEAPKNNYFFYFYLNLIDEMNKIFSRVLTSPYEKYTIVKCSFNGVTFYMIVNPPSIMIIDNTNKKFNFSNHLKI